MGVHAEAGANILVTVSNSIIQATDAVQAAVTGSMSGQLLGRERSLGWHRQYQCRSAVRQPDQARLPFAGISPAINTGNPAATDSDGTPVDIGTFTDGAATIAGRRIFYNNSKFDGNSSAAGAADDAAIATGKTALLPGGTATSANYTNYSRGINGVMLDIANLSATPTAADFTFRVGNDNTPSGWAAAPAPTSVTVRAGTAGGSSRVTITWADNAIQKQWLQVTAKTSPGPGRGRRVLFRQRYWRVGRQRRKRRSQLHG